MTINPPAEPSPAAEPPATDATDVVVSTHHTGVLALAGDQADWTPAQAAALRQLGLEDATADDLRVFLHVAQRSGLDPFARQIYMIGRADHGKTKYTIQTSIDGFRLIADRTGKYEGQTSPEWCGRDGVWRDVWLLDASPVAARIGVNRAGFTAPLYGIAHFREYAQTKYDGSLTKMWKEKPAVMIAKCAEALALRKAFPQDLSGMYIAEEMAKTDQIPTTIVDSSPGAPTEEFDWQTALKAAYDTDDLDGPYGIYNLHKRCKALGLEDALPIIAARGVEVRARLAAKAANGDAQETEPGASPTVVDADPEPPSGPDDEPDDGQRQPSDGEAASSAEEDQEAAAMENLVKGGLVPQATLPDKPEPPADATDEELVAWAKGYAWPEAAKRQRGMCQTKLSKAREGEGGIPALDQVIRQAKAQRWFDILRDAQGIRRWALDTAGSKVVEQLQEG